jgi:hypothetical protein
MSTYFAKSNSSKLRVFFVVVVVVVGESDTEHVLELLKQHWLH